MDTLLVKMAGDGRIVIPAKIRKLLGMHGGEMISFEVDDDETVRLSTHRNAIRRAQVLFRQHVPEGRSLVDELIADRRREAENE